MFITVWVSWVINLFWSWKWIKIYFQSGKCMVIWGIKECVSNGRASPPASQICGICGQRKTDAMGIIWNAFWKGLYCWFPWCIKIHPFSFNVIVKVVSYMPELLQYLELASNFSVSILTIVTSKVLESCTFVYNYILENILV